MFAMSFAQIKCNRKRIDSRQGARMREQEGAGHGIANTDGMLQILCAYTGMHVWEHEE
jgi:hypothetical protein